MDCDVVVMTSTDEMTEENNKIYGTMPNYNNKYRYILYIVDVFSRYAWSYPMMNKGGNDVLNCFQSLMYDFEGDRQILVRKPTKLWVDQGKEFYNKQFQSFLERHNIHIGCFLIMGNLCNFVNKNKKVKSKIN